MTLPASYRNDRVGDGTTTTFPYTFKIWSAEEMRVVLTDPVTGAVTEPTSGFSVTGVGSDGGNVVFDTAPADDTAIVFLPTTTYEQDHDLVNETQFFQERIEDGLDKLCRQSQLLKEEASRTIRLPESEAGGADMVLPTVVQRANKVLGFDADGNPIAGFSGSSVSTAMEPVVSSATLAAARAALVVNGALTISVKDSPYLATGGGTNDDTTAVQAAITAAIAAGAQVYWPAGTYLTTASITSFHSVRHVGPGVVKRGTDLFYIDPKSGITNIIYVATTGSDANDGISAGQPMATAQAAGNTIYKYPYSDATWKVQFAAGTYQASTSFLREWPSSQRIQFLGAAVADGVQPTTIFTSPTGVGKHGLYLQNFCKAYVEDIDFRNYADTGSPSASGVSSGITVETACDLLTRNVWASNCDFGIGAFNHSRVRIQAGKLSANGIGSRNLSNVTFTVGYGATAADITGATSPAILSSVYSAVYAQEGATGHVDYTYLGSNAIGCDIIDKSRVHAVACSFISNTTAYRARVLSSFFDNTTFPNTYTGNTTKAVIRSGAMEVNEAQDARGGEYLINRETAQASTSSTGYVTVLTQAIAASMIADRGAGFKVSLKCSTLNTTATKTVQIRFGGTTLLTATVAAGTATYEIDLEFITRNASGVSGQRCCARVFENGVAPQISTLSVAEDLTISNNLIIEHKVTNVADANRINNIDISIIR